jgi:GNAT superfamily N-acetyltransferase
LGYKHHPFYDEAESQTFLAYRDGKIVGRIAAIVNHAYNRVFSEPRGFFGYFESTDDVEVAQALFDTARQWLAERGKTLMRGPLNPSMNYECGLLIDGFDSPPTFMMTYNHAYYPKLFEACGLTKAQDLYGYYGQVDQMPALEGKLGAIADQVKERYGVTLRRLDRKHFLRDVETFLRMYNGSMVLSWDYVPISDSEVHHLAASLRYLLVPELALISEVEGKVAGVVVCLPDYNPRIKRADGRLFPFGFIHLLRNKRAIKRVRVVAINVLPEYQRLGVGLVLLRGLVPAAVEYGLEEAEFSWVAESNQMARMGLEKGGATIYKTYRIYDAPEV